MSEIEKMQHYIERTKMDMNDRFCLYTNEAFELAHQTGESLEATLDVIDLAFKYGKAKGYRAAKAERKVRV